MPYEIILAIVVCFLSVVNLCQKAIMKNERLEIIQILKEMQENIINNYNDMDSDAAFSLLEKIQNILEGNIR